MTPPAGISGSPAGVWSGEEPGLDQGVSGGGLTRKPEWPLQESPGWKPDALRSAGVAPNAALLCPQFCGGAPPGPGKGPPSPSSRPENAQMEWAWAAPRPSPPTGRPLPLISPAVAGPADRTRAAPAAAVVIRMLLVLIRLLPLNRRGATRAGEQPVEPEKHRAAAVRNRIMVKSMGRGAAASPPAGCPAARGRTRPRRP